MFFHRQDVPAVDPAIGDVVEHGPDEMQPEPADRPVVQIERKIGLRRLQRIEGDAVITDVEDEVIGRNPDIDADLMFGPVA